MTESRVACPKIFQICKGSKAFPTIAPVGGASTKVGAVIHCGEPGLWVNCLITEQQRSLYPYYVKECGHGPLVRVNPYIVYSKGLNSGSPQVSIGVNSGNSYSVPGGKVTPPALPRPPNMEKNRYRWQEDF